MGEITLREHLQKISSSRTQRKQRAVRENLILARAARFPQNQHLQFQAMQIRKRRASED